MSVCTVDIELYTLAWKLLSFPNDTSSYKNTFDIYLTLKCKKIGGDTIFQFVLPCVM